MKIGLLEWVCGGGLWDVPSEQIPPSLLAEGWSMLFAVASDLAAFGHEVSIAIDLRLVSPQQLSNLPSSVRVVSSPSLATPIPLRQLDASQPASQQQLAFPPERLPAGWLAIANDCEATLAVAPEISGVLGALIPVLADSSRLLCNCSGEFLRNSCDKLLTATKLAERGVRHPPTLQLGQITERWLDAHQVSSQKWIIKPRFGAGCEGIRIVDRYTLEATLAKASDEAQTQLLVQPWLSGLSFSRSALVDGCGNSFWLPLVTQELEVNSAIAYRGGRVLAESEQRFVDTETGTTFAARELDKTLGRALGALGSGDLGWIGFDLLYSVADQTWTVIEANPRLTTSFVGLNAACSKGALRGGLMQHLIELCQHGMTAAKEQSLSELTWQPLRFFP